MIPHSLIGTPFSTFTRTIALGLHYKNIPFRQRSTLPHEGFADSNHPYGYIPILIIEPPENSRLVETKIRETQAIARYIDRIQAEPSLVLDEQETRVIRLGAPEKMWELVSLTAAFGFPAIEVGIVKRRLSLQKAGATEDEIRAAIAPGLDDLRYFLSVAEALMHRHTKFTFASHPTWADFFLYPLLCDLRATPEWEEVIFDRLKQLMENIDNLDAAKKTREGTLEAGAIP